MVMDGMGLAKVVLKSIGGHDVVYSGTSMRTETHQRELNS